MFYTPMLISVVFLTNSAVGTTHWWFCNALLNEFFDELTCTIETSGYKSKYWWVEEIENPKLAERIKILSKDDLELLTKSIVDEYTQTELAEIYGIAQKNISKKLKRIKKFLSEGV